MRQVGTNEKIDDDKMILITTTKNENKNRRRKKDIIEERMDGNKELRRTYCLT